MLNNTTRKGLNFSLHFFVPLQKILPMKTSETPTHQSFTLAGVMHVSTFAAAEAIANGNALIVDVREQEEVDIIKLDVDNQIYMPLSVIVEKFKELPANTALVVVCSNGNRSVKAVNLLNYQGYKGAVNLDGGINQWYRDGLPLILRQDIIDSNESCGSGKSGGCGCSCGC
jgi:rhodanese-related sulfurtransferase